MNNGITIKRSPIVLIRMLVLIEALAFIAYSIAAALGNYNELYARLPFPHFFSYQAAKFLFLSGAQFLITIYAFFHWYYETYSIRPGSISHTRGVFFKKKNSMSLKKSMSTTSSSGPVGKLLHYGSISIRSGATSHTHTESRPPRGRIKNLLTLSDISYPEKNLAILKRCVDGRGDEPTERPDFLKLLAENEHEKLEFKSSLRFDHRAGNVNRELEKTAMKTIAAFLNSQGGNLVIGIGDAGKPVGLTPDYKTLKRPDSDGFENHFTQVFNAMIGPEFRHLVHVWFHGVQGEDVCIVQVAPSARPAYLKLDDSEHFYVRTGNVSTPLKLSEVESYARARWPRRAMFS